MSSLATEEQGRADAGLAERARQIIDRTSAAWQVPPRRAARAAVRLRVLRRWRAAATASVAGAPVIAHSW